jgi:hypothetical protein
MEISFVNVSNRALKYTIVNRNFRDKKSKYRKKPNTLAMEPDASAEN